MKTIFSLTHALFVLMIAGIGFINPTISAAADSATSEQDARAALKSLYDGSPAAQALGRQATGILVFPSVTKAGLIIGGQGGNGFLFVKDKVSGHYNTAAVSVGMQAGVQSFGYVLFFMSDKVLTEFRNSKNFQVGVGPNIVIVDAGAAKDMNNLTSKSDVYAMIFDQKGLMAGVGIQGSKITKLDK